MYKLSWKENCTNKSESLAQGCQDSNYRLDVYTPSSFAGVFFTRFIYPPEDWAGSVYRLGTKKKNNTGSEAPVRDEMKSDEIR